MSEENNDSFRDMNKKEKSLTVILIALLIILAVGFVLGVLFFGLAGIFQVLGVQYDSLWSLAIFVFIYFFVGLIIELFAKVIYKMTVRNVTGKAARFFIRLLFEGATNWIILFTVDEFMNSITLSLKTELIVALLLSVLEFVFDDDKEKNAKKKSA
ncbi:hypothetical protein F9U64_21105 [Gracilibacillus oryzae]|uniref:Regulatory protein YrvL n=1 Tax=Gracilibacillus oryzae TaxID=1672701 RepID=A0A7C8GQC7_9BACI|nr:regulatory YrvL family protein [Gracilibacillus oryzae]KAB8125967.1 hypothetical protein F9U64_21105 [Gracilibacillus oryzae]